MVKVTHKEIPMFEAEVGDLEVEIHGQQPQRTHCKSNSPMQSDIYLILS